jgi:SAM-dependent methyltransferase
VFYDYSDHINRNWQHYEIYLKRFKKNPKKLFEMGCGLGFFLEACIKNGVDAVGCEYSPEGVNECIKKGLKVTQHDLNSEIHFIEDESFDAVFCNQVIEHLDHEGQLNIVNEAYRILKPGGELLVQSPCRHFEPARNDKYHISLLTPTELKEILTSVGFKENLINMGYNRPQKIDEIPDEVLKDLWNKYKPDLFSQTATALACK